MADILLDIRDLSVVYATEDGVVRALNKATLQLHKGETLGLVAKPAQGRPLWPAASCGWFLSRRERSPP